MDKNEKEIKKNIRKSENHLLRLLLKAIFVVFALALQIFVFWLVYRVGNVLYSTGYYIYALIRIIAVIYILSRDDSSQFKIAWLLFIMFLPVLGIAVFFLWGNSNMRKKKQREIKQIEEETNDLLLESKEAEEYLKENDKSKYNIFNYVKNITSYPVCKNGGCKYYNLGEKLFDDLIEDIKNAKKYIFLEFYIVDKGELSDKVFSLLKEKVKEGVEVKLIYDAWGSIFKFKKEMREDLKASGVEVYSFNPIPLFVNSYLNNRLHRKVISIDGKISYTGGVNLADEYANIKERFGHWKDVGIRMEGDISWNFTILFLRDLKLINKDMNLDFSKYKVVDSNSKELEEKNSGVVCAMADGPNNRKNPMEALYLQMINNAKDYIYITTPYFAISEPMCEALLNSARSGVDVRVMLPHIPDKKIVQIVTKSYYELLLKAGIKVYEYVPGFIHSKTFVSDDNMSIVGTANMDFRSMCLNYECACITYNTGVEKDVKKDFDDMVNECADEIELQKWQKRNWFVKLIQTILRAFSTMF